MSKSKKVQFFIEQYKSKELSDANTDVNIFCEYNSQQLLQFKSPRPSQSFNEFNPRLEPKINSLEEDDIELDDNGESVATKREMFQSFQQFDVFLLKNRHKIEKPRIMSNQQVGSNPDNESLVVEQKTHREMIQYQQPDISAFSGLKDIKIDFNRVASNIPSNKLQEILNGHNNNGPSNTVFDIQSNMNSGRQILLNGNNPSSDSINNYGDTFSFFQNKLSRRKGKAMTVAQTNNIGEGKSKPFLSNFDTTRIGVRSVQDVILRLSIRSSLMVYRFIRQLKKKSRFNMFQDLSSYQLMLINDLSNDNTQDSKKKKNKNIISHIIRYKILFVFIKFWKYCQVQLDKCTSRISQSKPIDPTSNYMVLWLAIQFFFIIVAIFYTPLELINGDAYDKKYGKPWVFYKFINMIAFFLDIILKFNTGLFEKGQIVMNRREIVRTYFRGNFLFDLLALIPITQTLLQINYLRPINLLILLKVQTARRILSQIQEMISQKNNRMHNALSLLQLLLMICSVCHIFACLFMGIAVLEDKYELTQTNWMEMQRISGDSVHWFVKYNSALYFAVTTMITVGYGDIAPVTTYEIFFVTIAMFVSCGVFAYSFNQIGDLVREQNRMSNEFKNEMVLVNRLLEKKKINRDLKLQVRKFLEYRFYAEPQLSMEEERMVMGKLSHHLREKVILESNLQIINQCTLLTNNFSKKFLEMLALRMNEIRVSKNEIIFEQNDLDEDPSLFIIDKGNIEIFIEVDKQDQDITILQTLNQGSFFGEMNFFKEGLRNASARASDFTIIYGIPKSQFLLTIQDYPLDFEQYCFMRDSLIYEDKIKVIDMKCFVCGKEDHLSGNCNLIHYVPDKEKIVLSDNYSTKQQRKVQVRKDFKIKSIKLLHEVNEVQNQFMNQELNVNYILINYPFLGEDPTLTEENVQADQSNNTSNIMGQPKDNNINTNYNFTGNNNNYIYNHNNPQNPNPNPTNNIYMRSGNERPTNILNDIKRHVSNVYTSGGSILDQINKGDQSKNDISGIESPKSNEKQNMYSNFQYNTNTQQFSTANTQQGYLPNLYSGQSKLYQGRFGQTSTFQQQQQQLQYPQSNYLNVNSYPKKKSIVRRIAGQQQVNTDYEDDGHSTSFINNQGHSSPQQFNMIQQIMSILQKAMANPQVNTTNQGQSLNNIHSFSNLPNFGGGGNHPPGILKGRGTYYNNSGNKLTTGDSEDINWMMGNMSNKNRQQTRNLSYMNKKREKEMLIQQMQFNNQMYSDSYNNNFDISGFFEKSKIYTVYYPQHNLNIILQKIENTPLTKTKQPDYFGVYSFKIRPPQKKKQTSSKEISNNSPFNSNNNNNNNNNTVNRQQTNALTINVNGNPIQQSAIVYKKSNTPQFKHKGSINLQNPPKVFKETDSQKLKKNSMRAYNSLNQLKSQTLRAESMVFGAGNMLGNNEKAPTKSNFGQLVNASECASIIYQEQEKTYYPKFIFKKLFTLS